MTTIPLEDNFNDILAKALRGHKLTREQLAEEAGLDLADVMRLLNGDFDEQALRRVAPILKLGEETLVASGRRAYYPIVPAPHGLACFNTPYQDFFVNAYLAWDVDTREAVAFDTGSELRPMLDAIRQHDLTLKLILLTHTHPDHILKLAELKQATGAPAYVSHLEPTPGADTHEEGRTFEVGRLRVEARQTTGHSRGGTTYVVRGLDKDLAVVGDALFAGSMGGGIVSYEDALANNRRKVLSLPDDTVICPGHGPLSTIGLEKRHNPFYPELN